MTQAIKADPNYALAYAHMADAYRVLGLAGFANINEVWPKALKLAQKALEIDGSLAKRIFKLPRTNPVI